MFYLSLKFSLQVLLKFDMSVAGVLRNKNFKMFGAHLAWSSQYGQSNFVTFNL